MKVTEQYFPVHGNVALTGFWLAFKSVDGILKCDHLDESYWVVLSWGIVYY